MGGGGDGDEGGDDDAEDGGIGWKYDGSMYGKEKE